MKSNIFLKNYFYFFLFLTYFLISIFIVKDYGISVDEEFHRYSGFYWLNYILEFTQFDNLKLEVSTKLNSISGHTLPNPELFPFYGVTFDLPLAFLETIFNIDNSKNYFLLRHYFNFLIFFIGSIFFFLILKNRFKDKHIITLGILLYLSSPRIFGDSFYNNKDIIFLSLITINIFFFFKTIDKLNSKNLLFLSVFSALTCATRIIGIFIPILFILFFLISKKINKKILIFNIRILLIYISIFFIFLILFWPYLWSDPFANLINTLKVFSKYPAEFQMLFNGKYIDSRFLPLSYVPVWILITVPITTLTLFLFGYFNLFRRFSRRLLNFEQENTYNDFWRGNQEKKDFLIFLNFSLIFFYIILSNTDLYNGWRHLYFLHLFIIYFSCIGLYRIRLFVKKNSYYFFIFLTLISLNFIDIIRFHPFQGSYFNYLVYDERKNYFEVDYWGLAGVKFLNTVIAREPKKDKIKVGVASYLPLERSLKMLDYNDASKIEIVGQDYENADYIFSNNISEVNKNFNNKYDIPNNFKLINEFFVNDFMVYQVYQKN